MPGCCDNKKSCSPASVPQNTSNEPSDIKQSVGDYYKSLTSSNDLKTNACKTCKAPPQEIRKLLAQVPQEIKDRYYGCGTPLPSGIQGLRVLDLGCGTGRDCYVAASLVGEAGFVTGIDMLPEQLAVASKHLEGYTRDVLKFAKPNMRFLQGDIDSLEKAGVPSESQDLIISNCVINLAPRKDAVLREVYRVLAPGGEVHFSDIYVDRRLPAELRTHPVLVGECLGGALYVQDFRRLAKQAGFLDARVLEQSDVEVNDAALKELVGEAKFYSITYRLFKLPGLMEDLCEDYGQVAVYNGTLPGSKHAYLLDDHHRFVTGKPMLVCGNTAAMVQNTWLKPYFTVTGDRSVHYGLFPCGPSTPEVAPASSGGGGGGGGCC